MPRIQMGLLLLLQLKDQDFPPNPASSRRVIKELVISGATRIGFRSHFEDRVMILRRLIRKPRPSPSPGLRMRTGRALVRVCRFDLRLALLLLLFPHPFQVFPRLLLVMLLRLHLRGVRRHPCPRRRCYHHAGEKNQCSSTHSLHNSSTPTSYRSLGEAPLRRYAPLRGFPCCASLCFLASSRARCCTP